MAQGNEELLQIVLRARDELSAVAQKAAKSLQDTGTAADKLKSPAKTAATSLREVRDSLQDLPGVAGQAVSQFTQVTSNLRGMTTAAGVMAGAVVAGAAALATMVKRAADYGDAINRAMIQTNLSAETLSGLKYAAELADVSLSDVTSAIGRLNRAAVEASRGAGEQRDAFNALAIDSKTLASVMKDPAKLFEVVATQMLRVEDSANRDAIAFRLFGKSAKELLPFLQDVVDKGISGVISEAERLGLVITSKMAADADTFNDNLTKMGMALQGFANMFGPAIGMANVLLEKLGLIKVSAVEAQRRTLASRAEEAFQELQNRRSQLEGQDAWYRRWVPNQEQQKAALRDAVEAQRKIYEGIRKEQVEFEKKLLEDERNKPKPPPLPKPSGVLPSDDDKKQKDTADKARRAIDQVTQSLEDQVIRLREQILKLEEGEEASLQYALAQDIAAAKAELLKEGITIPAEVEQRWQQLAADAVKLAGSLEQAKLKAKQFQDFLKTLDMPNVGPDALKRRLEEIDAQEERGRKAVQQARDAFSDIFGTSREKEIAAARQWGEDMMRTLKQALEDVPALADEIEALMSKVPEAVEAKVLETSPIFKTLDGLAKGAFSGMIDAMTGAIEQGKSLNDVMKNMGQSLLMGLNRAILQAAFAPLEEALRSVFRTITKMLSQEGGIMDILVKFLINIGTGIVTGGVAPSVTPTAGGGAAAGGASFSGPTMMAAKGGIFPGHFMPLYGFQLRKLASGGVLPGRFKPLTGFSEPPSDHGLHQFLQVVHHVSGLPTKAFAAGGIARQPMFGLIGEGQFHEAVVPLPDNKSIPVKFQGNPAGQSPLQPNVQVQILGDVIPKTPGMSKADVIRVFVDDFTHDGPSRRAVLKHGSK